MHWLRKLAHAVRPKQRDRPAIGRVMHPREEDSVRNYPSAGLTPSKLAAVLREADDGTLSTAMHLYEEMEEKDAHLHAVANTRRLALTGLSWTIQSAATTCDHVDAVYADETRAYCHEVLTSLDSLERATQHLALALGRNIAIAEIVWDIVGGGLRPVEIAPVDFARIVFDKVDQPRILTQAQPTDGVAPAANKFIIHTPHNVSGHPQRGGLLRVTGMLYVAKNVAIKDWMIFAEIFGMPVRIARYGPSATAEEKRELLAMLKSLGANAAGIFSQAVDLQIVEANRGTLGPPYERLIEFINREISKAWLGQTLTTDASGKPGSLAASKIHEVVRKDLLADDIRKEAQTLRRDLLGPIVRLQFGPDAPVPHFRRKPDTHNDREALATILDAAVNKLGLSVPAGWTHETLGIPAPLPGEPTLPESTGRESTATKAKGES